MKKIIYYLVLILIIPCCFLFSACGDYDVYYADVPLDKVFSATLNYYLETTNSRHPEVIEKTTDLYAVSQKYETFAGAERFVTYVEWRQIGDWYSGQSDNSRTFLHVGDKTFVLNEENNTWRPQGSSETYYNYASIYSNITDSSSFRYKMTSELILYSTYSKRELPTKYKTKTTNEYIEYICKDNETFWVSNDSCNVLLKYEYDTKSGSLTKHNATFKFNSTSVPHLTPNGTTNGAETSTIPYLNTITADMLV